MLSKTVYRGLIPCYRLDTITTLVVDLGDNNNRFHSALTKQPSTVREDAHTGFAKKRTQSIERSAEEVMELAREIHSS